MGDYITDGYELIPTYTLQDLIKILPKCIEKGNILYYLFIDYKCNQIYYRTCDNNDWLGRCLYIIDYSEDSDYRFSNNECDETASNILNACFKMIKYCLQNKLYEIKSSNI